MVPPHANTSQFFMKRQFSIFPLGGAGETLRRRHGWNSSELGEIGAEPVPNTLCDQELDKLTGVTTVSPQGKVGLWHFMLKIFETQKNVSRHQNTKG